MTQTEDAEKFHISADLAVTESALGVPDSFRFGAEMSRSIRPVSSRFTGKSAPSDRLLSTSTELWSVKATSAVSDLQFGASGEATPVANDRQSLRGSGQTNCI
jgi:hypothetical protein